MEDTLSSDDIAHFEVLEDQVRKHDQQLHSIIERLQPLESISMQLNADIIQAGERIRADMRASFKQIFKLVCQHYNLEIPNDGTAVESPFTAADYGITLDFHGEGGKSEASRYIAEVPTVHGAGQFQHEIQSSLQQIPEVLQTENATSTGLGQTCDGSKTVEKYKAGQTVKMDEIPSTSLQLPTGEHESRIEVLFSAIDGDIHKVFEEMRPRVKMKLLCEMDEIDKLLEVYLIVGNLNTSDAVLDRTNLKVFWQANSKYAAINFVYDEIFKSWPIISFDCDPNIQLLLAEICPPTDKPPPLVLMHNWIDTDLYVEIQFLDSSREAGSLFMGFSLANLEVGLHDVNFSSILGDKDVLHWEKYIRNDMDASKIAGLGLRMCLAMGLSAMKENDVGSKKFVVDLEFDLGIHVSFGRRIFTLMVQESKPRVKMRHILPNLNPDIAFIKSEVHKFFGVAFCDLCPIFFIAVVVGKPQKSEMGKVTDGGTWTDNLDAYWQLAVTVHAIFCRTTKIASSQGMVSRKLDMKLARGLYIFVSTDIDVGKQELQEVFCACDKTWGAKLAAFIQLVEVEHAAKKSKEKEYRSCIIGEYCILLSAAHGTLNSRFKLNTRIGMSEVAKTKLGGYCLVQISSVQACIPRDSTALGNAKFVQAWELFKQPFMVEDYLRDNRVSGILCFLVSGASTYIGIEVYRIMTVITKGQLGGVLKTRTPNHQSMKRQIAEKGKGRCLNDNQFSMGSKRCAGACYWLIGWLKSKLSSFHFLRAFTNFRIRFL